MAAYTCVLHAERADKSGPGLGGALLERAKLLWQTGKREAAICCLEEGLAESFPASIDFMSPLSEKTSKRQQRSTLANGNTYYQRVGYQIFNHLYGLHAELCCNSYLTLVVLSSDSQSWRSVGIRNAVSMLLTQTIVVKDLQLTLIL